MSSSPQDRQAIDSALNLATAITTAREMESLLLKNQVAFTESVAAIFTNQRGKFPDNYEELLQFIHRDDRLTVSLAIAHSLETAIEYDLDFRIVQPDDTTRWMKMKGKVLYNTSDNPVRVIGTLMDITEQKDSQTALLMAQQRWEHLISSSPLIIYSSKAEDDYGATFVSHNVTAILGYEVREYLSYSRFWLDRLHPEDVQRIVAQMSSLLEIGNVTLEYRLRHKNGSYRWMHDELKLIRDAAGNPIEIVGWMIDITERKLTELILEQTTAEAENSADLLKMRVEQRTVELQQVLQKFPGKIAEHQQTEARLRQKISELEAIFQALPDLYFRLVWDGTIIDYKTENPKDLYVPPEDFLGKKIQEVLPQEVVERFQEGINKLVKTKSLVSFNYTLTINQEERYFEARLVPFQENQIIVIVRDNSDQVQAEAERQRFFEMSLDMLCIYGFDGYFQQLNSAWEKTLGWTEAELLSQPLIELIHPDDRKASLEQRRKMIAGIDTIEFENRYRCKDGSYRWIFWSAKTLPNRQLIYAVGRDITERKAIEEELLRIGKAISSTSDAIYIADTTGKVTYLNPAFRELFAYSLEELNAAGGPSAIYVHSADIQAVFGTITSGDSWSGELTMKSQSGNVMYIALQADAIKDANGKIIGLMSSHTDITQHKLAEEALQQSEARNRAMLQAIPDLMFRMSGEGIYLDFTTTNEDELVVPASTIIGSSVWETLPLDLAQEAMHYIQQALDTKSLQNFEYQLLIKGELRDYEARIVPSGEDEVLVMVRNITERKRAEAALRQTNQRLATVMNNAPIILYALDKDGVFTLSEGKGLKALGLEPGLVVGQSVFELYKDYPEIIENIRHMLVGNEGSWQAIVGDIVFDSRGTPLRDENGEVIGCIGVSTDITPRKKALDALAASEARFRELATKEALLNRLASQIRSSLDLNTILATAVGEIRNLLLIDHCLFIWYRSQQEQQDTHSYADEAVNLSLCSNLPDDTGVWEVVAEAGNPNLWSFLGMQVDNATVTPIIRKILNKKLIRIDDVRKVSDSLGQQFLQSFGFTAVLMMPIHTKSGKIGAFVCTHSTGERPWRDSEVELLVAVADQLAIAIDQAQLYKQSRIAAQTAQEQATKLEIALHELASTQAHLVQGEKMASLGQLVAGVAHEINNPVNFIYGNLIHAQENIQDLLYLVDVYQQYYPQPTPEIQAAIEAVDLDFLRQDLPKLLGSMNLGAERIREIVFVLRNFSRLDEAEKKPVDIHEGIDNTLLLLGHRIKPKLGQTKIEIIKDYGKLPPVECYPGQLNQVFMNLLCNAIDALEEGIGDRGLGTGDKEKTSPLSPLFPSPQPQSPTIRISTQIKHGKQIEIRIADNGPGISLQNQQHLFNPFFTTKPVGKGTGLGLSISYKIVVEKHGGQLHCISAAGQGAEFVVSIPLHQ
jgi:PAS domain S-box-containing protein